MHIKKISYDSNGISQSYTHTDARINNPKLLSHFEANTHTTIHSQWPRPLKSYSFTHSEAHIIKITNILRRAQIKEMDENVNASGVHNICEKIYPHKLYNNNRKNEADSKVVFSVQITFLVLCVITDHDQVNRIKIKLSIE